MTDTDNTYAVDVEVVQQTVKTFFVYAETKEAAERKAVWQAREIALQGGAPCYTIQRVDKLNG